MPYELKLSNVPSGYAVETATEGEHFRVAIREFTSSEDGELFLSRLDGFPTQLLEKLPTRVSASTVDHLVAVIRSDRSATVWLNECKTHVRARVNRSVKAGEGIFHQDIVDVDSLVFEGVEFPQDAAVLCVFSAGWRKGLFFDFGPLAPEAAPRDYDVNRLLGSYVAYLWSQGVFRLSPEEWDFVLVRGWFPFVSLSIELKKKIAGFARAGYELDRLLPELVAEAGQRIPVIAERWQTASLLSEHWPTLKSALDRFTQGQYADAAEGLSSVLNVVRNNWNDRGPSVGPGVQPNRFSPLLPDVFRRYLRIAPVAPTTPQIPEHEKSAKTAALALFTLDQLFFFLVPARDDSDSVSNTATPSSTNPPRALAGPRISKRTPHRRRGKAYISAPFGVDTRILQTALRSRGFGVRDIRTDVEEALIKQARRDLLDAELVCVVATSQLSANTAFELGIAAGMSKNVVLFAPLGTPLALDFLGVPYCSAPLDDAEGIATFLDSFLTHGQTTLLPTRSKKERRRLSKGHASELRERLHVSAGLDFERAVKAIFDAAGYITSDLDERLDAGADFGVWLDDLQQSFGNPVLVEVKDLRQARSMRGAQDQLRSALVRAQRRLGLLVYRGEKPRQNEVTSDLEWPLVVRLSADELLDAVERGTLETSLIEHRNRAAHGIASR